MRYRVIFKFMNKLYLYIYFALLLTCLVSVALYYKKNKSLIYILLLLIFSILTEVGGLICQYFQRNYYPLYHLFTPIEYSLIANFFYLNHNSITFKKLIFYSIPIFIIFSILCSTFFIPLNNYPGFQYNIEGILVITWSLTSLFKLSPKNTTPLYSHTLFWIASGFFIFHTGIFFINGVFNYFFMEKNDILTHIHTIINVAFNYILYIFILVGILCSRKIAK